MALNTILQSTKPDYWNDDVEFYENARYKTFTLPVNSQEYTTIKVEFCKSFTSPPTILEIQRVQHPYAYVSCQIKRKQVSVITGTVPKEKRVCYYPLNEAEAKNFLEYNCDERHAKRYTHPPSSGIAVFVQEISCHPFRSSSKYPDYLIKYNRQSNDLLSDLLCRLEIR